MHSIRLPCVYYFFLAVVVIGYETTATACWTLLFIVRAFFNDTITVAVWTGFHVHLIGMLPQPRDYTRWCFADPADPHDCPLYPPIADIPGFLALNGLSTDDARRTSNTMRANTSRTRRFACSRTGRLVCKSFDRRF